MLSFASTSSSSKGHCWVRTAGTASLVTAIGLSTHVARCEEDTASRPDVLPSQEHLVKPTELNPSPTTQPPPVAGLASRHQWGRHVVVLIGLPFRGKAHMARRLQRYLEFFHGLHVELFDVNNFLGTQGDDEFLEAMKSFFDGTPEYRPVSPAPRAATRTSTEPTQTAHAGRFAIVFPSNTYESLQSRWSAHSKGSRKWMADFLQNEMDAKIIFVEIQADDSSMHREFYTDRMKQRDPASRSELNVKAYSQRFVTLQEDDGNEADLSFIKLINYNSKVVMNNMMSSFAGCSCAEFLASVHPYPRTIYLSRHGESVYNVEKKIGGDSPLSPLGEQYAKRLAEFSTFVICQESSLFACVTFSPAEVCKIQNLLANQSEYNDHQGLFAQGDWGCIKDSGTYAVREGMRLVRLQRGFSAEFEDAPTTMDALIATVGIGPVTFVLVDALSAGATQTRARLWTSSLRRTQQTAEHIQHPKLDLPGGGVWEQMSHRIFRNLDEVYAGEFEGLTYDEVKRRAPKEASLRKRDKLGYRYPRGESYYDIITRLERAMIQAETIREPLLIIGHQAVHRLVYSFLRGIPRDQATELPIPLHTVIRIDFDGTNDFREVRYFLGPTRLDEDDGQKNF